MPEKNALTTQEAMHYLNCTKPTLLKMIREKKLKAFKVGGHWRILYEELRRYCGQN